MYDRLIDYIFIFTYTLFPRPLTLKLLALETGELKIGLAFSGGGYRASSFSLGVLSYLNEVSVNQKSLLQSIYVISTVSGGTITGTRYAVGIKQGESFRQIYDSIYTFMTDVDIIDLSLGNLTSSENWGEGRIRSLINAVADVYDKHLFNKAKFGTLLSEANPIHIKHLSFNSTEFSNALQFRFQWSEKLRNQLPGEPERGIIGNSYYNVPLAVAEHIRMADILAASSCFPGGFEPINFPTDFCIPQDKINQLPKEVKYPVGLMDGGIVDNQGIEPLVLAEERLKRDKGLNATSPNVLDLLIVSDVTSPYMAKFEASVQKKQNWWRKLTPALIFTLNTLLLIASGIALFIFARKGNTGLTILFTAIVTITLIVFVLAKMLGSLPKKFEVPDMFFKPLGKLMRLKLLVYENLVMNRANSLMKMAGDVFLKHVRRLNYSRIYKDDSWENRRIMNAIYELRKTEKAWKEKINKGELSPELAPSDAVGEVARKATVMGTTLWFTKDELEKENMLDTIIACGQFTMCWNLLEYIHNIEKNNRNTNQLHLALVQQCKAKVTDDWNKFKADPYWMVNQYKPLPAKGV